MSLRNEITTMLVILSAVLLFTSSTANALDISSEANNIRKRNYTITEDGSVIVKSLFGDITIPIPDDIKTEIKAQNDADKRFERLTLHDGTRHEGTVLRRTKYVDFVQCTDEADLALSSLAASFRDWETFFRRNKFEDTVAVRYCCNLLEYAERVYGDLSPECRGYTRLAERIMLMDDVRHTCRQYYYEGIECFLVRWMYWWIPIAALILAALVVFLVCCCMRKRRTKAYLKAREDDKHFRNSLVNGTAI